MYLYIVSYLVVPGKAQSWCLIKITFTVFVCLNLIRVVVVATEIHVGHSRHMANSVILARIHDLPPLHVSTENWFVAINL